MQAVPFFRLIWNVVFGLKYRCNIRQHVSWIWASSYWWISECPGKPQTNKNIPQIIQLAQFHSHTPRKSNKEDRPALTNSNLHHRIPPEILHKMLLVFNLWGSKPEDQRIGGIEKSFSVPGPQPSPLSALRSFFALHMGVLGSAIGVLLMKWKC